MLSPSLAKHGLDGEDAITSSLLPPACRNCDAMGVAEKFSLKPIQSAHGLNALMAGEGGGIGNRPTAFRKGADQDGGQGDVGDEGCETDTQHVVGRAQGVQIDGAGIGAQGLANGLCVAGWKIDGDEIAGDEGFDKPVR